MAQSLAKILIHVVFTTKHRAPFLRDMAIRRELHRYMMGTLQSLECWPLALDGGEDHVHFLCQLSRKIAVMDLIEEVKTASSKWIKTKGSAYRDFHWQSGYGVFSVSESKRGDVVHYIQTQEETLTQAFGLGWRRSARWAACDSPRSSEGQRDDL